MSVDKIESTQEAEIRQRLAVMEANPAMRIPFAEADLQQMFKEILDERAVKATNRS